MSNDSCPKPNPDSVENQFNFPWETEPEDRTSPCEVATRRPSISLDPIESIAYIGQIIEEFLNEPRNLKRESLRDLVQKNGIKVHGVGFYDTAAQGEKPCVYIKYAGMKSQQDFAFHNSVDYNNHNAVEQFYSKWTLGFSVYVVGNQYMESLAIAEEVRRFLHYFQLPIKQALCWEKLQVIEAQAPAYDDTFQCYTSAINLTATFGEAWNIQEMAPLLKKATLNTAVF